MPQAQVHDVFRDALTRLADQADVQYRAAVLDAPRKWAAPYPLLGGWLGDPLDVPGLNAAFDRAAINANYQELLVPGSSGPAAVADAQALKIQCDYVAARHRALATRHATVIRSELAAAARRRGHADERGIYLGKPGVKGFVDDLIATARKMPPDFTGQNAVIP